MRKRCVPARRLAEVVGRHGALAGCNVTLPEKIIEEHKAASEDK